MVKKLRVRFIALAMGVLLIVLVVIMGAVNILNYKSVTSDADAVLALLVENDGMFPKMLDGKDRFFPREFSPEMPYESRFFTARISAAGIVVQTDTGRIAAVDTKTAAQYAVDVWENGRASGFVGNYRYAVSRDDDGGLIVFLDCSRGLRSSRDFLTTSCEISLAGFAVVFILLVFFSGRIVKPVSESYEKQRRFITDAGHELKTPLTIIDADVDVLELDMEENEWLGDIKKQTSRLALLTNDLIYLSRMEEGDNHFTMIDFPLSDVVSETAQSFRALAIAQSKRFLCDIQPMLSMRGDEKSMRRLCSILLDNAIKYSGESGEISLKLERAGRFLKLEVKNSSEPIAKEDVDHLFERFYRADKSRSSSTGGHGIGLSIAKAIVQMHKGEIKASSADGHSLTITALFPA